MVLLLQRSLKPGGSVVPLGGSPTIVSLAAPPPSDSAGKLVVGDSAGNVFTVTVPSSGQVTVSKPEARHKGAVYDMKYNPLTAELITVGQDARIVSSPGTAEVLAAKGKMATPQCFRATPLDVSDTTHQRVVPIHAVFAPWPWCQCDPLQARCLFLAARLAPFR